MYRQEMGVLEQSEIYFNTPGVTARTIFFHLFSLGHFWCNGEYQVRRSNFEQFLIMYVKSGSGIIESRGQKCRVKRGNLIFLDCYAPHAYAADPEWEIYWFHLDGPLCRAYYEQMACQPFGMVSLPFPSSFELPFSKMIESFQNENRIQEHLINKYITDILTLFFESSDDCQKNSGMEYTIEEITSYICNHLEQKMNIESLALKCSMSSYHFIRIFKAETGYTPHEFIIQARIHKAKYYLQTTSETVKKISHLCGFQNASSFCACFKKVTGHAPSDYRTAIRNMI